MIVAFRVGEVGFLAYVKALQRLGVLRHAELLNWLTLHGHVLRATEPPLDTGDGVPDSLIAMLLEDLAECAPGNDFDGR